MKVSSAPASIISLVSASFTTPVSAVIGIELDLQSADFGRQLLVDGVEFLALQLVLPQILLGRSLVLLRRGAGFAEVMPARRSSSFIE